MKHPISIFSLVLLAMVGTAAAVAAPGEHVLRNLCSGPPGDPLPPVRANHPSAAEMAARPRQHPYLFFDAVSRQELRDRMATEPFASLAGRLRAHAEECLKRPIPPQARSVKAVKEYLPDGSFNPEFLRNNYDDLYQQSAVVMEVIPTLGFAYQLTGDLRYGDAGKQWLLNYAARPILAKKDRAADFGAADVMFGLSLGYDWLWELLSEPERALVQNKLAEMAGPMMTAARKLLENPHPERIRGDFGNNHPVRTHGLFGMTTLALLYELPEAQEWFWTISTRCSTIRSRFSWPCNTWAAKTCSTIRAWSSAFAGSPVTGYMDWSVPGGCRPGMAGLRWPATSGIPSPSGSLRAT